MCGTSCHVLYLLSNCAKCLYVAHLASKPEDYKELESTITNDLYKVKEYFDTNKLSLNVPNCE